MATPIVQIVSLQAYHFIIIIFIIYLFIYFFIVVDFVIHWNE